MARLNEPMVSTDNLEILRRKFLRQNRDIARINSTQSLKIRSLENECARLLSENLELRGKFLGLENDLKGSHAQRVADHALQIKEKMEAQLVEWGSMLASLGHEPIPRNRSPRALKKQKLQRSSFGRTGMTEWKRRETIGSMQDLEAAALQQGRLAPLWENSPCPRESFSQDQLSALRNDEAEESTDSPDLGPPPVSRFVDEDPVKLDLSTLTRLLKPALCDSEQSDQEEMTSAPASIPASPSKATKLEAFVKEEPIAPKPETVKHIDRDNTPSDSQVTAQAAKANLKRKAREEDERENAPTTTKSQPSISVLKAQLEKTTTTSKPKAVGRPIKELPSNKKDSREKQPLGAARKPLGAKNSNEALQASPKKATKPAEKPNQPKGEPKREVPLLKLSKAPQEPAVMEISAPTSPLPVAHVDIEPESLAAELDLAVPDTPQPSSRRDEARDTPPPVDISASGETARGSRRARAAVSYAEPNLRDKMRRPNTKQLFDAVAGEGKSMHRSSISKKDELPSGPSSVAKSGGSSSSSSRRARPLSPGKASDEANHEGDVMGSPLVQKTTRNSALEESANNTDERDDNDNEAATKSTAKCGNRRLEEIASREAEVAKIFSDSDVYDFPTASPKGAAASSREPAPALTDGGGGKPKRNKGSRQSRSRRMSSMAQEDLQPADTMELDEKAAAPAATKQQPSSRKRASMAAAVVTKSTKTLSSLDGDDAGGRDSPSLEGDSLSSCSTVEGREPAPATARERTASRRRSMML
ncbi:hypothetical protein F5Y16DRAFT_368832 [Xylariaceae sp. FL0255]|nr:hypothetical protein F5Y16DRAFT_368832 [Xylariaceae sp. FL0255]